MIEHILERELEWEPAAKPIVLEHFDKPFLPIPPFITGSRKLTIQRDERFRLSMVVEGVIDDPGALMKGFDAAIRSVPGTFRSFQPITFNAFGVKYDLLAFFDDLPSVDFRKHVRTFNQDVSVTSMTCTYSSKFMPGDGDSPRMVPLGAPAFRSDWFINGAQDRPYMRWTRRRQNLKLERCREFGGLCAAEDPHGDDRRDHFVVKAGVVNFAVSRVPEQFAPDWCHPIAIEYRAPIPTPETRRALAEIVSFVIGRRLIPLGSTLFDDTGWPIEKEMLTVVGQDLKTLCADSESPPVPMNIYESDIEQLLATLVPSYLKAREALADASLAYWIACEAHPPVDLAHFRAALEALKMGWLEATGKTSDGSYMPKREFDNITKDLFDTLADRLGQHPARKQILDRLRGCYQMSGNEGVRLFLADIGIPMGKAEENARKAANRPAHGAVISGDLRESVRHARAYRTLFVRAFLRVLGYDGLYTDYATDGFPPRPLGEPAGGTGHE